MIQLIVDKKKCTGCGTCINVCPVQIYELKAGKAVAIPSKVKDCLLCRACEASCPQSAIVVKE